jgi:hypothetical protein
MTEAPRDDDPGMPDEGYRGPATLVVEGAEFAVRVDLRGHFQPIDGRYRWYGRVEAHEELTAALGGKKRPAEVRTRHGSATGELSDPDPWQRYRVMGTSRPPFPVPSADPRP